MADPNIYTVGWICAIKPEIVAARAFLDEEHKEPMASFQHDNNTYTRGKMANHSVVIAVLPKWEYGIAPAATVARDMLRTFPNIRIGLMVGVGGGVPSHKHDIRLGDVVIASRDHRIGGVFQYDYGRRIQDQPFETTGVLNQPPQSLLTAVASLEGTFELDGHQLNAAVEEVLKRRPRLRKSYSRPPLDHDRLFRSNITHPPGSSGDCSKERCAADPANLVPRNERGEDEDNPAVHYGLIASANQLMKDAQERDLAAEKGVLCFEMEAAGLMNHFPCLVVRGICDYSDTHKNQDWQGFAAMMAAAYAKDLLWQIAPNKVEMETRLAEILESIEANQSQHLQTMNETKATVEAIRYDSHVGKVRNWLSPPDTSTNYNHARESRHEGTGSWFINSTGFAEWKLGSRQHLWLYGLPGCGKTVLSTKVLDHLKEMDDYVTLEFFFDFNDTGKQKPDDMCRSLVFQLYTKQVARKVLDDLMASHDYGQKQPTTQALFRCLWTMIQVSGKLYIVLDALDECDKRKELLEWMRDFISCPDLAHVQLIVTGRPEEEFKADVARWIGETNCIPLDKASVSADIWSYIGARLKQSKGFSKWTSTPAILRNIQDEVGGKADGMFRWAACQLDSLETCLDREELEAALKALPRDLNTTYDRILQNIPENRKKKAILLLQFLVYSKRPLTLQEAVDAIAVRVEDGKFFDPEYRLPRPTEITRYCPSLVDLVETRDAVRADSVLQLAHFSVKEYLLRINAEGFRGEEAQISITQTCLLYLRSVEEDGVDKIRTRFPLARYAAEIWMDHAKPAESSKDIVGTIVDFLQNATGFRVWARLFNPERPWAPDPGLPEASSLYYACQKGLTATVTKLLLDIQDVNAQGGYFGNALQGASERGHKEIAQMLIDNGANVNAQGGKYGNALQGASERGHKEIVQMLIDNGANVNAQGGEYGNALQGASQEGHGEIAQMLIDNGANVNAQGGKYGNALQGASERGHKEIVQMLIDNGANVNAQGGEYGSALQGASERGHKEIVQILVDNGADVNAQGGSFGSALQAASERGHKEIAQILVDNGADVNTQGGGCGNALQAASERGHKEIAQILVDNGADVNSRGGGHGNALRAASQKGHGEIAQMLINNGADVNAQGGGSGNALQAASEGGHTEIAQMLIDNGADVNSQGGGVGNALQAASEGGHTEIAQMLIDNGADVNAQGGSFGSALQAASRGGCREIAQILIDNGADVNTQGGGFGNALQAASDGGHKETVQILIDNGANVNAQGGSFGNALQAASFGGHKEIVQNLIKNGADINTQGGYFSSTLQAASFGGHKEVIQILIDNGANINAQGGEYGNTLQAASYRGHNEIVQILVDSSANVNSQGGKYGNALQAASYRGHKEIVQILIDNGANINSQGGKYGNALQAASEGGHTEIAQMLIDNGADVDTQGGDCGNAL
ncbi:hypothetical protein CMEL01_16782 [Colletotrichum melonis]|uniref:NACHT domain-containing protein n=1 Tax=Colletotrichum melonis TaxID=1209925 RepID=A0AAI9U368_9PEZI|nr:hypothetical protein CMEL01_16782 [Colletotrichum melonis]